MKENLKRWIELLQFSGANTKKQVLEEMKACLLEKSPTIAYLCDKKQCANCTGDCEHTLNIKHAINFKEMGGVYFEQDNVQHELKKCTDSLNDLNAVIKQLEKHLLEGD